MEKLRFFWEELNTSFWFIPILMLTLSIGAAISLIYLDNQFEEPASEFSKYFFSGGVESARSILTIIASATIGIAGTVFSITLVALTLASSQLGSRLLRNFMYDKINQVVLGTYVSTFAYCLIVLNTLTEGEDTQFVPVISVFVGLLAALAGIILLIVFIHHISVSIQSDKVIADISNSMTKHLRTLFPDQIGKEESRPFPDIDSLKSRAYDIIQIKCTRDGYLQSVNSAKLMELAGEEEVIINFKYRPGDHLVKDLVIGEVLCTRECSQDMNKQINRSIITGKSRTPLQDAEFSINQVVEVASRALSPGVNDPFTAIACIDNLTSVLCYLAAAEFPSRFRFDKKGNLRIIAHSLTFSGMLDASFNQIRQYGAGSPAVMIRLMEALLMIGKFAANKDRKQDVLHHAEMVIRASEKSFIDQNDINDIIERHKSFDEIFD